MFKFTDKENENLVDLNTGKSFRKDSQYYFKRVIPWLNEGNEIEPFKTQAELDEDERQSWEDYRDELENNIVLKYEGNLYYMIPRARHNMAESLDDLEETGDSLNWPVYDASTGEKKRVKVGSNEIKKFRKAIRIAIDDIHVQADTGMPINPWPLEVE